MATTRKTLAAFIFGCVFALFSPDTNAQSGRGFPDARMQDFERQRACELNLPNCLPQIRRQMEEREVLQMWQSGMIIGVLVLIGLLVVRANNQKKQKDQEMLAKSRQAARKRKEQTRKRDDDNDDDFDDGLPGRSTLERPAGFGRR